MTVYLITGVTRGLGYEFLKQLSRDPANIVIGLARRVAVTEEKVQADNLNTNSNIHIVEGDVTSYDSFLKARSAVEKITPKIDILIANAAALTLATAFTKLTSHEHEPELLVSELQTHLTTNVIGAIITINVFLPLVLKSDIKKVIAIGSGLADDHLTNKFDIWENAPYTISKAALNTAIAKYNAAHGKTTDRVLFMSLSPGLVDTGNAGARECFSALFTISHPRYLEEHCWFTR